MCSTCWIVPRNYSSMTPVGGKLRQLLCWRWLAQNFKKILDRWFQVKQTTWPMEMDKKTSRLPKVIHLIYPHMVPCSPVLLPIIQYFPMLFCFVLSFLMLVLKTRPVFLSPRSVCVDPSRAPNFSYCPIFPLWLAFFFPCHLLLLSMIVLTFSTVSFLYGTYKTPNYPIFSLVWYNIPWYPVLPVRIYVNYSLFHLYLQVSYYWFLVLSIWPAKLSCFSFLNPTPLASRPIRPCDAPPSIWLAVVSRFGNHIWMSRQSSWLSSSYVLTTSITSLRSPKVYRCLLLQIRKGLPVMHWR